MSAVSRMKIRNRLLLNITLALAVSVSGCVKAPPKQYVQPQNEQVGGVAAVERQEIVDEMKERDKAQLVQFQRDIKKLKGRHPFSPYAPETEVEALKLILQGVVFSGGMPAAIINDTIVKVGDMIEGAEVVKIVNKRVTLIKDGKEYELELEFE